MGEEIAAASGAVASSRRGKLATKPSGLKLYERRACYSFPLETALSEALPARGTPEEQVAAASLFDFFRLVQFHGGRSPHLTWHRPDARPIVMFSLVVKLK